MMSIARRELFPLVFHHGAVVVRNFDFRVGQQLESRPSFAQKPLMGLRGVDADTQDHGVGLLEGRLVALEIPGFDGAPLSKVFGVKVRTTHLPR